MRVLMLVVLLAVMLMVVMGCASERASVGPAIDKHGSPTAKAVYHWTNELAPVADTAPADK